MKESSFDTLAKGYGLYEKVGLNRSSLQQTGISITSRVGVE